MGSASGIPLSLSLINAILSNYCKIVSASSSYLPKLRISTTTGIYLSIPVCLIACTVSHFGASKSISMRFESPSVRN